MLKKISGTAALLVLAALLALIPPGAPEASAAGSFKDTAGHWSRQAVEKSFALELINGYPGGLYKPEDPVSRLEAVAIIIRAMGLQEEAANTDYKNSGIIFPQEMSWGHGHLVMAVRKGLIHKDYTHQLLVNGPITRAEVATLVALALQHKLKIKGDVQKLSYSDSAGISPHYRQYVADVTQNNIMQGTGNNEFGPGEVMKRGQMAALMAKTVQDGWFDYGGGRMATGTLTAVDSGSGILTIAKSDGTLIFRLVNTKTVYCRDAKLSSLGDFRVGDPVLAVTGGGGQIKYLEYAPSPEDQYSSLTGRIVDRSLAGSGALKIRDISRKVHLLELFTVVTVTDGAGGADRSYLTEGRFVEAKVKDNAIHSIRMLPSEETEGEVTGVFGGHFTIKTSAGGSRLFSVKSGSLNIAKGGGILPYADLKAGDRVKVISVLGEVLEITVLNATVEGEVRTVDAQYRMVTVLSNSTRREYEVEAGAVITKGGGSIAVDALGQGDRIAFKVGEGGKIYEINVLGSNARTLSGKVTDLQTAGAPRIFIGPVRHYVDPAAAVTRDGGGMALKDIIIGAEATLYLDRHNTVTGIEITNDRNITAEGAITAANADGSRITIEQNNGHRFTLNVDGACAFRDFTPSPATLRGLADIRAGWTVSLSLTEGRVVSVRVIEK